MSFSEKNKIIDKRKFLAKGVKGLVKSHKIIIGALNALLIEIAKLNKHFSNFSLIEHHPQIDKIDEAFIMIDYFAWIVSTNYSNLDIFYRKKFATIQELLNLEEIYKSKERDINTFITIDYLDNSNRCQNETLALIDIYRKVALSIKNFALNSFMKKRPTNNTSYMQANNLINPFDTPLTPKGFISLIETTVPKQITDNQELLKTHQSLLKDLKLTKDQ